MVIKPEQVHTAVSAQKAFKETHDVKFNNNREAVLVKKPDVQLAESNSHAARERAAKMSRYN